MEMPGSSIYLLSDYCLQLGSLLYRRPVLMLPGEVGIGTVVEITPPATRLRIIPAG